MSTGLMEPMNNPVWRVRVEMLHSKLVVMSSVHEVMRLARQAWGWSSTLTANVLAAGENRWFFWDPNTEKWRRSTAQYRPVPLEEDLDDDGNERVP